ncbi:MAG: hypothetical protein IID41_14470, partial [Planctomycetes bacterium]|nr:hypothetical protein [Planctomycetota bacterium]
MILHPGSGGRHKCWPAPRFVALLAWLRRQGRQVAVLWGPAEQARRDEFPLALSAAATQLCPATPWDLAHHLAAARLYIGNDTGPGHLAAAVGCATLSLFHSLSEASVSRARPPWIGPKFLRPFKRLL